jgi:inorganic pyrophosphatase
VGSEKQINKRERLRISRSLLSLLSGRNLSPAPSSFRQADGDRLLSAGHLFTAAAASEGSVLSLVHCFFNLAGSFFPVSCHGLLLRSVALSIHKATEGPSASLIGIASAANYLMKRKQAYSTENALTNGPSGFTLTVVIETPKGSRNKYAFDPSKRVFVLRKVLPEGMAFPQDFGFIPSTRGADGDPLDVLVLMDEPTFAGCVVEARLIGVLEGEKSEGGRKISDHRFIAVAVESQMHSNVRDIEDLNDTVLDELERFFENYQQEPGREFKVTARRSVNDAARLLAAARKNPKLRQTA